MLCVEEQRATTCAEQCAVWHTSWEKAAWCRLKVFQRRCGVSKAVWCRLKVFHFLTQQVETLEVTDPYSRSLAADGRRSMFVDLDGDTALMPEGWLQHRSPQIASAQLGNSAAAQHLRLCSNTL